MQALIWFVLALVVLITVVVATRFSDAEPNPKDSYLFFTLPTGGCFLWLIAEILQFLWPYMMGVK